MTTSKLHETVCRAAGVPLSTDADAAVAALTARWDQRAAAVGLPAGLDADTILAAERNAKAAVKLAAALRAAGNMGNSHSNGVKMLTAEEAQDVLAFGCHDRLTRRRAEQTEEHLGKDLKQALQDGDLR